MKRDAAKAQPQEAVIPSEGAVDWNDPLPNALWAHFLVTYGLLNDEACDAAGEVLDIISKVTGNTSTHSVGTSAASEPKPSTREAEAPVSEAVAWMRVTGGQITHLTHIKMPGYRPLFDHPAPSPASAWKPGRDEVVAAISSAVLPAKMRRECPVLWSASDVVDESVIGVMADAILALSTPPATEGAGE
ncbi:hypothetical protein [Brevundimonas sp. NIBR10]|uniref:hypothetical protein n=1 Tax=Brevundimonas sp. NIBR10 TaxID=3015997 RepID=UPI0022F168EC|nr:hypothetical protein [Brevundimonas sp. NIBR10]